MTASRISWETVAKTCPTESASIIELLDKYDIRLNEFFRGVTGGKDWHDVVDLRDCRLKVTEIEEAKLEDSIINQLQAAWDALNSSFESATDQEGLCHRISEVIFENEFELDETVFFDVELARPKRG